MVAQPDPLADAFADDPAISKPLCPLGKVLHAAGDTGRARLEVWLASDAKSSEIGRRLVSKGITVSKTALSDHRRSICCCFKQSA